MDLMQAMKERRSVRSFTDQKIEGETLSQLKQSIALCNRESGLSIQLCLNEPTAFSGMMARYGKFTNVKNYIVLAGKKGEGFEEKCGYYGEKVVLAAQQLGLNTCWVAMTFSKSKGKSAAKLNADDKMLMVIAVGYGTTMGAKHAVKPISELSHVTGDMPAWFLGGMEATQLAPTAMNQQKFLIELNGNTVKAKISGLAFYTKVDLGIVKYHFEIGAGKDNFKWA
ncbi:MAG: nitroreductase [Clostridiales bacterium]|nr:nitroreductase [Clostridiales bacterium]